MMDSQGDKPIVRAIDVGYGNTKYVALHPHGEDIQCSLFPSVAPQASSGPDLAAGVFQKRNTVIVDVGGVRYEVGKDAALAQDPSYSRSLTADYSLTDTYLALTRGALSYMGLPRIDYLVVGLPVNTVDEYGPRVKARLTGVHPVPFARAGQQRDEHLVNVEVRNVTVVAQPIGAFFDHSIRNKMYDEMRTQMNLLIDPGYYTLDWVVAKGVKPVTARSGAHPGGMSVALGAIAEAIGKTLGVQITDVGAIDEAIRTGRNPRFYGKEFTDFPRFIKIGHAIARQGVSNLATRVGNGGVDIDNIILAGGGAEFFKPLIAEKFPQHQISITKDPVFANVRGFQLAGEQWANQTLFNARRGQK